MTDWVEQWICIKLCVKLEHSSTETIWMIQKDFGDNAMRTLQINVWQKRFKDDWESVESHPCSGRAATSRTPENVEHVWTAINKYQWLTVRELEAYLRIPKTSVSEILTQDIGTKHVVANICSTAPDGVSNKIICRVFWTVGDMLAELCEVPRWLLWRGLRLHCPVHDVSLLYLL